MVNALGAYIQSVFANPMGAMPHMNQSAQSSNSTGVSGATTSNGVSPYAADGTTAGFYFRGSLLPLIQIYQPSVPKPQLLVGQFSLLILATNDATDSYFY